VHEFLRDTGWYPAITETVAGATPYTKYNPVMRWMISRISAKEGRPTDTSRDHEFTDWEQIDRLAVLVGNLVRDARRARPTATRRRSHRSLAVKPSGSN
jgi:menaquinone-dependent protoporphyrinogen oxidase